MRVQRWQRVLNNSVFEMWDWGRDKLSKLPLKARHWVTILTALPLMTIVGFALIGIGEMTDLTLLTVLGWVLVSPAAFIFLCAGLVFAVAVCVAGYHLSRWWFKRTKH